MHEAFDCFEDGKNTNDYHVYFDDWWQRDLATMVKRTLNHPSIVMWSIGNEIPMRDKPNGTRLYHELADEGKNARDLSIAGMYIQSRERSINRRHGYTKQTASAAYHSDDAKTFVRPSTPELAWSADSVSHSATPCLAVPAPDKIRI